MSELPTVVVAKIDRSGLPAFEEFQGSADAHMLTEIAGMDFVWEVTEVPEVPSQIGQPARDLVFPKPGGVKFGRGILKARSAGKLNVKDNLSGEELSGFVVGEDNPAMHQTDTVDMEFIVSGKVDMVLPGGKKRTLQAGDFMVMGGLLHEWSNPYNEDCVFAMAVIGAERTVS